MARKNDSNEQGDPCFRRGRLAPAQAGGVLRAKDIIPPYDGDVAKAEDVRKAGQAPSAKDKPATTGKPGQEQRAIPKFDLAEEIMAEQRKSTARRRRRPTVSAREALSRIEAISRQPQAKPVSSAIGPPSPIVSEQEQIIAEIVARDIEKFRQRRDNGE